MSLSAWSYPFHHEAKDGSKPGKRALKKKINSATRFVEDESSLADYEPEVAAEPEYRQDPVFFQPPTSGLAERLDYMIHLLEKQQDEKTGRATEEMILYVFLGVFVIFVLETFVKTGRNLK
jgi:hypothetical protein